MPEAIAIGELLVDFVSTQTDRALSDLPPFVGAAGGAPANVAVGLAKLGINAGFMGKVGNDPFGEFLRHTLKQASVDTSHLLTAQDARTTLVFAATRSDGKKDLCFYRNPGADLLLEPDEINEDYIRQAKVIHYGSVSLSGSPAREATIRAMEIAREAGLLISYDPNWRPTVWGDHQEGYRRIWEAMKYATIVKLAEEEWEFVTGTPDLEQGSDRLLKAGPRLVVVTRGEQGCYYDDGSSRGYLPGFQAEVVDTLGAGDAFVAAMLARLMKEPKGSRLSDQRLRKIMEYANAAGAIATQTRGVIPALPTAQQIAQFLAARSR